MINIREMNKYKRFFEDFINLLPLEQMEFDIQNNNDPLIGKLYQSVFSAEQQIKDPRYKNIYHKIGILGIYSLFDVVYSDFFRWILFQVKDVDFQAKPPNLWRSNEVMEEK